MRYQAVGWLIWAFLSVTAQAAQSQPLSTCPAQLPMKIEAVTNRLQLRRASWGILVQTPTSTIYSRDSQRYFVPASNAKLLTTAAALQSLGPQFRIRTSIYGDSHTVRVVGRGDPSLTDTQLTDLAQQLSRQGIHQLSGIIADDSYFKGVAVNPSWEWEDVQLDYGTAVNSLILNQNAVELTLVPPALQQPPRLVWSDSTEAAQWQVENRAVAVKSDQPGSISINRDLSQPVLHIEGQLRVNQPESVTLAVLDPAKHFLQHFRNALSLQTVTEVTVATTAPNPLIKELAFVESPPLSELLIETNQNSNNLYAEVLLRTLGVRLDNANSIEATDQVGLRVVKSTLTELGVDPTSYILVDGSGLSRHNLVSPEALVQTLKAMAQSKLAAVYRASLPVAGISGTLRNRFRNTTAQGIVQAKTGSMSGVSAISGYLNAPDYEPVIFSIIVNQSDQSATVLRQSIDEIVLLLTTLHRC